MKKRIVFYSFVLFVGSTCWSAPPPIPGLAGWEAHMISEGVPWGEALDPYAKNALSEVYYDGQEVALKIYKWTGDERFMGYALKAQQTYRDRYVLKNFGGSQGFRNFTMGMRLDYEMFGDDVSKETAFLLSRNAAYARVSTPIQNTQGHGLSRETAYALRSAIDSEMMGFPVHPKRDQWLDQVLDHIDQLVVQKLDPKWGPFMVGLSARSLIMYYEQISPDPRIIPVLENAADIMWNDAWVAADKSFWYRADNPSNGAPDLNMLIAPMYAWLWKQTGNNIYLTRGDQIFEGGVLGAGFWSGKQFCQYFTWSFEYVEWRGGAIPPAPTLPSNQPPTVNAGPDMTVLSPCTFEAVNGNLGSDDGLPNPPNMYTLTWFKESGPGRVYFDDVNDYQTIANFSKVGTYVIRLDADDGLYNSRDTFTVDVFDQVEPNSYLLTVTDGNCTREYTPGSIVRVASDYAPKGYVFDRWTGDTVHISPVDKSITRVTMPSSDIGISAFFIPRNAPTYPLTVNFGSGSGDYAAGASINIVADPAPTGQEFDKWTESVSGVVVDVNSANTTVTMPSSAVNLTATFKNLPPAPPPTINYPTLPQNFLDTSFNLPTCGNTVQVNTGDDLQQAINDANPCDVLVLEAGATFTGNFVLPNKPNPENNWIYIISSELGQLPEGTRVRPYDPDNPYANPANPGDEEHMPKLVSVSTQKGLPTLTARKGANHYRLAGIELTHTHNKTNIVLLGDGPNGGPQTVAELADNIIFDRSYIHAPTDVEVRQGFNIRCKRFGLVDSYVSEIKILRDDSKVGADPLGVQLYQSPGPSRIHNNYISASGENLFLGDSAVPAIFNPTDVTITQNYLHKPIKWNHHHAQYAGVRYKEKNLFEIKGANRVLFEGNVLQNAWLGEQEGYGVLIKSPGRDVANITVRNNEMIDTYTAFGVAAQKYPMDKILIRDNLAYNPNQVGWRAFRLARGGAWNLVDLGIVHNTVLGYTNTAIDLYGSDPGLERTMVRDNFLTHGTYGIKGGGTGSGLPAVEKFVINYDFDTNVLVGNENYSENANFKNFTFVNDNSAIGFSDNALNKITDFQLKPTSLFAAGNVNQATDGKDVGADIGKILLHTTGVRVGTPSIQDPEPNPNPNPNPDPDPNPSPDPNPNEDLSEKFVNVASSENGFTIEIPCESEVRIYNQSGDLVATLSCSGNIAIWNAEGVPAGIYFVHRIGYETRKVVVVK